MSSNAESSGKKVRRSSLKTHDNNSKFDSNSLLKQKTKRNSVSWGQSNTFQFKAMKAMFQECNDLNNKKPKKEIEEKHQKFLESRKKSIKNEFSIVKELLKNKMIEEEDEIDDEIRKNTDTNVKFGHEALNEMSESSSSSSESEGEDEK